MATDLLGAHVSTAGGIASAARRADDIDSRTLQLFTASPRRWKTKPITELEAHSFGEALEEHGIDGPVVSHASYLLNTASPKEDLLDRSVKALIAELDRGARLGLDFVVLHPGSATDGDRAAGVVRNGEAVATALEQGWASHGERLPRLCLEVTSGKGNVLGSSISELARIMEVAWETCEVARQALGCCLDTCHLHSAGYSLEELGYRALMEELARTVGTDRVWVWHLNDSVGERGSHVDRHAHIGQGTIGTEGFAPLLGDPLWAEVPMLLETPKEGDGARFDRKNLETLRALREPAG